MSSPSLSQSLTALTMVRRYRSLVMPVAGISFGVERSSKYFTLSLAASTITRCVNCNTNKLNLYDLKKKEIDGLLYGCLIYYFFTAKEMIKLFKQRCQMITVLRCLFLRSTFHFRHYAMITQISTLVRLSATNTCK